MSIMAATFVGVFALSAGLMAWLAIDLGTSGLARYRDSFTRKAEFHLRDMFVFLDARRLFFLNLASMVVAGGVVWFVTESAVLTMTALAVLALVPRLVFARMRRRRLAKFEEQLADALLMLSGSLRAGVSLSAAIQKLVQEAEAPLSQEFELMLREQRLGVSQEDALNHLARRMPTQTVALVVSAMRVAAETGGGLAETLERTSTTVRARLQMEGKIRALTAQGKLQVMVMGLLPALLLYVLNHLEPETMGLLWNTGIGWATLGVIVFMEAVGVWLIKKIVTIDV